MSKTVRVVRVPIERPDDETWKRLRALACQAARFGNRMLAGQYIARMSRFPEGLRKQLDATLWADSNDELSGWVRGAMQQKCKAQWTRSGKDILAGRARLACFSADRALSISADLTNNRGVLYERDGESFVLACRFEPVEIRDDTGKLAGRREPIRLTADLKSNGARKDAFIREALELVWSGSTPPGVVTLRFDRQRRKLTALISYSRPAVDAGDEPRSAVLGPVDERGHLFLRVDNGETVDFSDPVRILREKKEHFAGLVQRLRHGAGRKGRKGRYYQYRRKLEEVGSFAEWSDGVIHQLSRAVITKCRDHHVGRLAVDDSNGGDLPWDRLKQRLQYKAEDMGIVFGAPLLTDATVRARAAEVRKRSNTIRKARVGIAAARELIDTAV